MRLLIAGAGAVAVVYALSHFKRRARDWAGEALTAWRRATRSSSPSEVPKTSPSFSFGCIADIQYADHDDAPNFKHTQMRRYRGALESAKAAAAQWKDEKVSFAVQLGDVIDGRCKDECGSLFAVDKVYSALRTVGDGVEIHDVVGNHELYNFTRPEMIKAGLFSCWSKYRPSETGMDRDGTAGKPTLPLTPADAASSVAARFYYDWSPAPGWRCVILDTYDQNVINDDKVTMEQGYALLEATNPNNVRGAADWTKGLRGTNRRFVPYNGGVGPGQLAWLKGVLRSARLHNESVIIFSHIPIQPGASESQATLIWNYQDVLDAIHVDGKGAVLAVLSGHAHQGGYKKDSFGVHHRTLEAPLECDPGQVAYATVDVYSELRTLVIRGQGRIPDVLVMK